MHVQWRGALIVALLLAGCNREAKERARALEQGPPELASMVHVADPKTAFQLISGFHSLELNSWRWTMGKFAVLLRPPAGAAQNGATLLVKLNVPEPVAKKLGPITLSAQVGNVALKPEPLPQAGDYEVTRDVPASALSGDSVTVSFALDKVLGPGEVDKRELGVIVTTIGLEPK